MFSKQKRKRKKKDVAYFSLTFIKYPGFSLQTFRSPIGSWRKCILVGEYSRSIQNMRQVNCPNSQLCSGMSTHFTCRCVYMVLLAKPCGLNAIYKPRSWIDTRSDVPLNVLTKTYGILSIIEGDYSIFCIAIFNSQYFVELFNKLDELDTVFHVSKAVFTRRRILSTFLVILPVAQLLSTFWLRKFNIQNIGAHINFFFLMLQGSIFYFVIVNIYVKLLMLNALLMKILRTTMSKQREIIFKDTVCDWIIKSVCVEPKIVRGDQHSWFELMQIYDKLADCVHLFNEIYCGQIFFMYNTWLLGTLLTICRSLSPSLKYSEIFLSDLFLYFCINGRPLILATISEMFIRERKKTVEVLLHVLRLHEEDDQLFCQTKTIIMLVTTRKLEISANVFTINVPTVMNFAGRIISYTVLMIQYFYSHDNQK